MEVLLYDPAITYASIVKCSEAVIRCIVMFVLHCTVLYKCTALYCLVSTCCVLLCRIVLCCAMLYV